MHCPQCGQQQAPGEVRFCSRCGLPLSVVSAVVAQGGAFPAAPPPLPGAALSPRQRGVRQGLFLMLSTALVVPFVIFLLVEGLGFPEELIPLFGVLCAVGGFLRMLYALLFESNVRGMGAPTTHVPAAYVPPYGQVGAPSSAQQPALPPRQSIPVNTWQQRPETSELAPPSSVTEHTTKLLDQLPPEKV
ncbi:MAG: hypothetical protein H0T45_05270 [Pyrinomonadaceae bacterium]|nr:hypothetical protein [Pyrinomonadaceae bacterium]